MQLYHNSALSMQGSDYNVYTCIYVCICIYVCNKHFYSCRGVVCMFIWECFYLTPFVVVLVVDRHILEVFKCRFYKFGMFHVCLFMVRTLSESPSNYFPCKKKSCSFFVIRVAFIKSRLWTVLYLCITCEFKGFTQRRSHLCS